MKVKCKYYTYRCKCNANHEEYGKECDYDDCTTYCRYCKPQKHSEEEIKDFYEKCGITLAPEILCTCIYVEEETHLIEKSVRNFEYHTDEDGVKIGNAYIDKDAIGYLYADGECLIRGKDNEKNM